MKVTDSRLFLLQDSQDVQTAVDSMGLGHDYGCLLVDIEGGDYNTAYAPRYGDSIPPVADDAHWIKVYPVEEDQE